MQNIRKISVEVPKLYLNKKFNKVNKQLLIITGNLVIYCIIKPYFLLGALHVSLIALNWFIGANDTDVSVGA